MKRRLNKYQKEYEKRVAKFRRYIQRQNFNGTKFFLKKNILNRLDEVLKEKQ